MLRQVNHRALAIAGYAEPWSGPAGMRRLSVSTDRRIASVGIRRLDRDGMPVETWPVTTLAPAQHRTLSQGAWLEVDDLCPLGRIESIAFEFMATRNEGARTLLDTGHEALRLDGDRMILRGPEGDAVLGTIPPRQWLNMRIDRDRGELLVTSLEAFRPFRLVVPLRLLDPVMLRFGSDRDEAEPTLNCRLAAIAVGGANRQVRWSFPTLFSKGPLVVDDVGLMLRGNPTFAVTSARWDGSSLDPRLTPTHYDAIHLHDTDLAGLDWPASYEVEVPAGAESGVYAFELVAGEIVERIPFFVTAGVPKAKLLFVVPTATYLAYADEHLPPHLYEWIGTDRAHEFARDNELRSLYDYHADGSGVSLASTRRPKATVRDDYVYPLCGDPHGLPVDLHFLKFCAREGITIDVVTDAELHAGGAALLSRYAGVATGSHPEYLSSAMEEAYRAYIAQGGHLAYLGGNGFAAVVAFKDDLMELRRGPTQSGRTWDGPLGEMPLALTNEPGGYFRDRGRGEYKLVGVGISLMGFSKALPFTRTAASTEFDWLFEGVSEVFGGSSIVLGGAAGYEVDCTSPHLGTPPDVVVLATATGFPDDYVGDPGKWFEAGAPERAAQRRADMIFWRHASGGAVFSASSVSFLGALPGPGADNDVGRLTRNLLTHFSNAELP